MVDERSVEAHHQPFAGGHAGGFFQRLCLDRHLVIGLQRIDEVNSLAQSFAGDFAEVCHHTHMAGTDPGHGAEEEDHQQECGDSQANQAQQATSPGAATVNNSSASWIKNRHRCSPCWILGRNRRDGKWLVWVWWRLDAKSGSCSGSVRGSECNCLSKPEESNSAAPNEASQDPSIPAGPIALPGPCIAGRNGLGQTRGNGCRVQLQFPGWKALSPDSPAPCSARL